MIKPLRQEQLLRVVPTDGIHVYAHPWYGVAFYIVIVVHGEAEVISGHWLYPCGLWLGHTSSPQLAAWPSSGVGLLVGCPTL